MKFTNTIVVAFLSDDQRNARLQLTNASLIPKNTQNIIGEMQGSFSSDNHECKTNKYHPNSKQHTKAAGPLAKLFYRSSCKNVSQIDFSITALFLYALMTAYEAKSKKIHLKPNFCQF